MRQTGKFFHYNFEKKERNKNLKNCIITRGNNYWNSNFLWKDELWHFPENDEEQYQRSFPVVYHYPPNVGEFLLEELTVSNQLTLNPGFNEFECQPHTIIKLTYTGPSDEVGIFRDMDFSTHEDIKNSYLITINEATKKHIHVVMGIGTVAVAHLVFNAQSKQIPRIKEIFDYPYNLSDEIYNKLHFTSPYYALILGDDLLEVAFMRDELSNDTLWYSNSYDINGEFVEMTSDKEEYHILNTHCVIMKIKQSYNKHISGNYGIKEVKYMNPGNQNYKSLSERISDFITMFGSCASCLNKVVIPDKVPEKKEENVPSGKYAMTPDEEEYKIGKGKLVVLSYSPSQKVEIHAKIGDEEVDVSGKKSSAVLFTEEGTLTISNKKNNNNKKSQVFMYIYDISNYPPFDYWIFITGTQTIQAKDFGVSSKSLVGKRIAIFSSFFKSTSTLNIKLPKGADAQFYSLDGSSANIRRHTMEVESLVHTEPIVSVITPSTEDEVEDISFEIATTDYPELAIEVTTVTDINEISIVPQSSETPTPTAGGKKLSVGSIIGICVGCVAVIGIIIFVPIFIIKRKNNSRVSNGDSCSEDEHNSETNSTNKTNN
ncbi:hypothetical protein TVAG_327150 [Trichomonas vaginalis G3]|uniref:Uncharacterized protein n=1 Tax=Trichomonas vaginalis (strain ATCC PRA-98 / G3) TaxID=412133 RepID=A2FTR7_TRIV3|nr:hypothetical protein TVAGG3_0165360 [Trichomonas vaginalis G3]EAX91706.1 hypothetical protein TVAG_327150 [Trichomonas vaginalis G3]KAI5548179.1 hypothetical protein TVAGG3_0165360 [Trichomonas vaginalis G3]|eukprot:XP_001304636.1 hypothetical protein [Trichomonas vaginalis G3]